MGGFKLMSDNCAAISADPEAPGSKPLPLPMPWPLPLIQQYAIAARHITTKLYNTAVHRRKLARRNVNAVQMLQGSSDHDQPTLLRHAILGHCKYIALTQNMMQCMVQPNVQVQRVYRPLS